MLGCLILSVYVNVIVPVRNETFTFRFCEPETLLSNTPPWDNPLNRPSMCDVAAREYIYCLQMAGVLPGSMDAIHYRAACTTTI